MCAHAVRMAILKVEGVDSVTVSLNEGKAHIVLQPENSVTVNQIIRIVKKNGFTPKGAEIRIAGKIVLQDEKPVLRVPGQDLDYLLSDHPEAVGKVAERIKTAVNKQVIVQGYLPENQKSQKGEQEPSGGLPELLIWDFKLRISD